MGPKADTTEAAGSPGSGFAGLSGRVWAALLAVYIIWGTTYLAIRIVVQTIPPLLSSATRFTIAGALLYLVTVRRGDRTGDRPTARQWRNTAIIGFLLAFGGNGIVTLAEQTVPSGLTALIIPLVPIWLVIGDRIFYGKRLRLQVKVGIVTGFLGAVLLVWGSIAGHIDPVGLGLILLATILWSCGSLFSRTADLPKRPLVGAGMEMLLGGLIMFVIGTASGEWADARFAEFSAASLWSLVYLIVFGSIVAFTSYVWLIRNAPVSIAGTYAFVNPVVAVFLGWLVLSEPVTPRMLFAGLVIVVSVALIVLGQAPRGSSAPADPAEARERLRAASDE